ncbi:sigma-E factor negative regulatory protein [Acidovorax sp. GBBC 3334]|uniref:sigma-E factor negative regulatory protein n=1 Tax=unclassified Acidovorax TaxID=2684926 RepID=UPI002303D85C|nr:MULTISPECIES: sigma-E factor negative regulatory protein [unclassified Acidovorax]MDA8454581.1 sigma-E factor negative regulatory protein [Acidovorax sp. GBBC 3334]MDA8519696.1 sigma-E factor negative regulatory protein [Acidovorax sp. NCPPB 4044]
MKDDLKMREQLSALADGELESPAWGETVAYAQNDSGRETWATYHLIGDVLRSADLAKRPDTAFAARVMARLEEERISTASAASLQPDQPLVQAARADSEAANAAVFRWKVVAGLASLAAVGVLGWNGMAAMQAGGGGSQLASATSAPSTAQTTTLVSTSDPTGGTQVMLRDARLDELLAAHRQYGGASALQMPAGFLRNATFETPAR